MAMKSWSTTAGNNDDADASINWLEGQAPSTVNGSARAMMAALRTDYEGREWRDWGHTVAYASATTFTIATDVTAIYVAGRPIKCTDSSTLYGKIASSSYSAPNTTVTVTLDSGSLSASLTAVALGFDPTGDCVDVSGVRGAASTDTTQTISGAKTFSAANTFSAGNTFSVPQYFTSGIGPSYLNNYSLGVAVAANALTITLTGYDGTALSATNKAQFNFRSATAATGTAAVVNATADLTLTVSSGSTLGSASGVASRYWIVIFNDAGTLRLGIINCSTTTAIYHLSDDVLASATAEGGAGAADSAGVIYAGAGVTSKPMRVLGYIEATEATAGTWATSPSKVQLWTSGMKLPGDVVQSVVSADSAVATGTTLIPTDDTIPQNTEGDQYMSQAITPVSAINILKIELQGNFSHSVTADCGVALFQDSTADALTSTIYTQDGAYANNIHLAHSMKAGTTSATTFKIRAGGSNAGTTTFNGIGSGRKYGGACYSRLAITEVVG